MFQPYVAFYAGLGDALYAQGKTKEAAAEYERAIKADPGNALYKERLKRVSNQ